MSVISRQYLKDVAGPSATYVIEIKDFRKKLAETSVGSKISTKEFFVNWSKLGINLYIAGGAKNSKDIGVFLVNHSNWMVRAKRTVSVKKEVLKTSKIDGTVHQSKNEEFFERSCGWSKCVPLCRCVTGDLLSGDGTLTMEVKVELLGENIPVGGNRDSENQKLKEQMASLKHKVDNQETELSSVKAKLRKVGSVILEGDDDQPTTNTAVKCPMCSKVVARPMRLQQCPKGHIICDSCYTHLLNTREEKNKYLCATCKGEKYCGRPVVLEQVLGLLDDHVLIDSDSD